MAVVVIARSGADARRNRWTHGDSSETPLRSGVSRASAGRFPPGLTPDIPAADYADDPRATAVALEARRLVELRDRWLNPPE